MGVFLCTISCIEPFEAKFKVEDSIIVVDGNLTDTETGNYVILKRSVPSGSATSNFAYILDASVEILVDEKEITNLKHRIDGIYDFPEGFKAENGHSYQLKFTLPNGSIYTSVSQELNGVTPIISIKQEYRNDINLFGKEVSGHKIYLTSDEPEGKGNAYYWTYRLFENENYCLSCFGGTLKREADNAVSCEFNQAASEGGITYDYNCDRQCWRIFYSESLNAMNDAFVDGKGIIDRLIADIPYYNKEGALLEIQQHGLDDQAYKYIKLLIDQNQNSGSLADTPSTALNGNIRSLTNPNESIGGYFLVSSVSTVNYFINRNDVPSNIKPIGFVNGRIRTLQPAALSPPLAPCINSRFMTPFQPENWISQ
jgi:hypothetical protein